MKRFLIVYESGGRYVYEGETIFDVLNSNFSGDEYKQIVEVIEIPY